MSKETYHPQNPLEEKPDVLALYAITTRLLSAPGGYAVPPGGLKEQLRLFCKKSVPFEPAWRTLNKRYLKIVHIISTGRNSRSRYELYAQPREDIPPIRCLTSAETKLYLAEHPFPLVVDTDTYLPKSISWPLLKDKTISLGAKGLLILLIHEQEDGRPITKQAITGYCESRHIPFQAAWSECLKSGHLKYSRIFNGDVSRLSSAYTLSY